MKTIIYFLKPYKLSVILAISLSLVELFAELLFPFILGIMINQGIAEKQVDTVMMWGSVLFGITVIAFISGIINSYFSSHISNTFAYDVREKLFEKIQHFSFNILSLYPTSMILTRFTNDIRQVQNTVFMSLRIMIRAPLMVIGSVIVALIINIRISLIFIFIVPILILFLYWVLVKGGAMFSLVQSKVDTVNRVIQENIAGMRIIKAFVRKGHEEKRFNQSNRDLQATTQSAFRFVESSMPVLLFVMNLSLIFIIWYGNKQSIAGTTSVGDVVAIVNYALRTVMSISMFTFISLAFSRARASSERIAIILNEQEEKENTHVSNEQTIQQGKIVFDHVSFSYPNHTGPVLDHIHFTVSEKETIAIIGATGSGKTTLFQLIPRLYTPTHGTIYIDDIPLEKYPVKQLRDSIGYVSQNPLLFTGTIADNIRFGKEDATMEEVIIAAKNAQIHESIVQFPGGYESVVGQKGVNLSGGQKQRISIARALVRYPKVLMFDDSTSALDLKTEHDLLDALGDYDCSTLIITQKVQTAQQADRILLLDAGRILAIGSHASLLKDSALYQSIVASQAEGKLSS